MAEEALSREDFIAKHGFDPEESAPPAPQPAAKGVPSLGNAARDLASGFINAIPSAMALPGVVASAGGAAYDAATSDAKFGESFAKRLRVDDADKQEEEHVVQKLQEWKKQYPEMSADDLRGLAVQYGQSKEFEDFRNKLLRTGVSAAARIKSSVSDFLGDTRSESEKSWVDSALEAVGGAAFGVGPGAGANLASKVAGTAAGKALLTNPVTYGALRTAEALTPITLPLTPGNFALNAGAGVAIDQGMRYAMGDTTALSDNDTTLGGLATVAGVTGAAALAVGALRGRSAVAAGNIPFPSSSTIDAAVRRARPGEAVFNAGKELAEFADAPPKPALSGGSIIATARNKALNVVDENRAAYDMIAAVHGPEVADLEEAQFSNITGAGGRDTANARTATLLRNFSNKFSALSPDEAADFRRSLVAEIAESRNLQIEARYNDEIADLATRQRSGKLSSKELQDVAKELQTKTDELALFTSDHPDARRFMPELTRSDIQNMQGYFRNNTNPRFAEARQAFKDANDQIMADAVDAGLITKTVGDEMRTTTPYYAPFQQDPLEGATGLRAIGRGFLKTLNAKENEKFKNINKPLMSSFDTRILTTAEASRVTRPLDPLLTFSNYARHMYTEIQNNTARRLIIDSLEKDAHGNPSPYMANNNIQRFSSGDRIEFTSAELRGNPSLRDVVDNQNYVRVVRNGLTSFYRFGDPELAALMRFEPSMYTGGMWVAKTVADLFKMNTTGPLAPVFSIINAGYDTTLGGVTKPPNRAFGPLDTMLRKIIGETWGQRIGGRIFDPTAYAALPWHMIAGVGEVTATKFARYLATDLANSGPVMNAISKAMGPQAYEALVHKMLLATERSKTMIMLDKGIMHNSAINDLPEAANAFSHAASAMPQSIRTFYQFYKDIINSIHSAPKRQFYAQNFSLLERKYGPGNIPKEAMDKLVYDTRALAGDMTRRSGNQSLRNVEAVTPYLAPMRNGVYHLARSLGTVEGATYAFPRLFMAMSGVMASFYMMSNWDDKAREEFWLNTPEWMRYRYIMIPTPELMTAWAKGEKPAFDPRLIYKMPIGPDLAPIIAGSAAFLRGIGALPNGPAETATTGLADFSKMTKDMFLPVFPPILNAPLAAMGATVDISGSDARAGNVLRVNQANPFRKGPETEAASNLGEMNSTTQTLLATLFGSNGMYIARSMDALLHASKYDAKSKDAGTGLAMERSSADYIAGLRAATTTFVDQQSRRMPDVPLLWKADEKQYTSTPVQNVVSSSKSAIASINGIRDSAQGPRAKQKREVQENAGGINARFLTDEGLLQIADDIRKWDRNSDYADLKKEYGTLAATRRALEANYTMPKSQRTEKVNALIDQMQENMNQQRLAIMYKEQEIKERYGPSMPALAAQPVTMQRLDQMMRASIQ